MSSDPLDLAGQLAEEMRRTSDLLKGAVTTLVAEGWSEEHAQAIVVATYVGAVKRGQQQ